MWLTLLGRFWYVPVIGLLALAASVQTHRLHSTQAEYATFQVQVRTLGEQAERDAKLKEKSYADTITAAVTSRADAYRRLHNASAAPSRVPLTPDVAAGNTDICFDSPAFAAAVEQYRRSVRGLVTEGDAANIDAKALIDGWPKPLR